MYCAQNNRIYCSDCNKSLIPNNYSNHLKSKGHYINVMKKQCDNDISHCVNNDLTCCMNNGNYHDRESIREAKAMLEELYRNKGVTWAECIFYLDRYINKDADEK